MNDRENDPRIRAEIDKLPGVASSGWVSPPSSSSCLVITLVFLVSFMFAALTVTAWIWA